MSQYKPRLKERYDDFVPAFQKELGIENVNEVPKVEKVVVNIGQGIAVQNIKVLESAIKDLEVITGQKAIMTKAKKSIAGFKLREGMPIGCSVTLRANRMYEFFFTV